MSWNQLNNIKYVSLECLVEKISEALLLIVQSLLIFALVLTPNGAFTQKHYKTPTPNVCTKFALTLNSSQKCLIPNYDLTQNST